MKTEMALDKYRKVRFEVSLNFEDIWNGYLVGVSRASHSILLFLALKIFTGICPCFVHSQHQYCFETKRST